MGSKVKKNCVYCGKQIRVQSTRNFASCARCAAVNKIEWDESPAAVTAAAHADAEVSDLMAVGLSRKEAFAAVEFAGVEF